MASSQSFLDARLEELKRFVGVTLRILRGPQRFFTAFHETGIWKKAARDPLGGINKSEWDEARAHDDRIPAMRPLAFLGFAIGLNAITAPIAQVILAARGMSSEMLDLARMGWAEMGERYNARMGTDIWFIDLTAPTGIGLIDGPIESAGRALTYAVFAALFWLWSRRQLDWPFLVPYFAFAIGASFAWEQVLGLPGAFLVPTDFNTMPEGPVIWFGGILGIIEALPRLYAIFILPWLLFPAIMPVTRGAMIRTTLFATLSWVAAAFLGGSILWAMGFAVRWPGL